MREPTEPRYGLADRGAFAGRSGRELLQAIVDGELPQAPISRILRFRLVAVGDGFAAFEGETSADLLNPMGGVHGGWALTLIDSAAGCAGLSVLPAGSLYTTLETKANFCRPIAADTGRVRAEALLLSRGRQILTSSSTIRAEDGTLLAHGTSTLLVQRAESSGR